MEPSTIRPLYGSSRMIERAAVVFPQPDSPARPRDSPSPREKSTPSTAWTSPSWVSKYVLSPLTSRRAISPPPKPRVHDLVEGVPEEGEAEDHADDREARGDDPPGELARGDAVLEGLLDHLPPRVRVGPQAEVAQEGLRQDRHGDRQDPLREDEGEGVREHVPPGDPALARADRAGPVHELPLLQGQRLGPDEAGRRRPEGDPDHDRNGERGPAPRLLEKTHEDEGEDDRRQDEEEVRDPHEDLVDPAPVVARDEPHEGPEAHAHDGRQEADQDRNLGPPPETREDVPPQVVRPQPHDAVRRDVPCKVRLRGGAGVEVDPAQTAVLIPEEAEAREEGRADGHEDEDEEEDEPEHPQAALPEHPQELPPPVPFVVGPVDDEGLEGQPLRGGSGSRGPLRARQGQPAVDPATHRPPSLEADSRVQPCVQEVGDQVRDDDANREEQEDRLHERIVLGEDRLDGQEAQAVVREDLLDLDGPPEDVPQVQGDDRHHREAGVRHRVLLEDHPVREPLRAGRQDVVLREDVRKGVPHDDRDPRKLHEGEGERREDPMAEPFDEDRPGVRGIWSRKGMGPREERDDPDVLLEQDEEDVPEPERGDGVEEEPERKGCEVERLPAPPGGRGTNGDPEPDRDDGRGADEEDRPDRLLRDDLRHEAIALEEGVSPVPRERVHEVLVQLDVDGVVEAEDLHLPFQELGVRAVARPRPDERDRGIPGHHPKQDEVGDEDDEDRDCRVRDLLRDDRPHGHGWAASGFGAGREEANDPSSRLYGLLDTLTDRSGVSEEEAAQWARSPRPSSFSSSPGRRPWLR